MAKPREFRSDSQRDAIIIWLRNQTRRDATIYMTAAGFMAVVGFFATVATFIFVYLVLLGVLACSGIAHWAIVLALALLVMAGLWYWHLQFDQPVEQTIRVEAGQRGLVTLRLTPLTGTSWLMFLDRPAEHMYPVVRFVTNMLLLSPRLCSLAWRMANLSRTCQTRDFPVIAAGLDRLMDGGRFAIGGLLQEFPDADPQVFITELTGIEGVVFLAGEDPALTLTPSFHEEFEQWRRERRRKNRAADY